MKGELRRERNKRQRKNKRIKVYNKYGGHCAYCGIELKIEEMTVDHVFPKSLLHFSGNEFENLNPSCRQCNSVKSSYPLELFRFRLLGCHKKRFYFETL